MDDMEKLLQQISLMKPTSSLRQRIFDEQARPSRFAGIFARRIPLGWAAVFALFVGLAGYALASLSSARLHQPTAPVSAGVDVQIVETGTDRNFFDFSHPQGDMLPGEMIAVVDMNEEV
jgi:hypothetical protein